MARPSCWSWWSHWWSVAVRQGHVPHSEAPAEATYTSETFATVVEMHGWADAARDEGGAFGRSEQGDVRSAFELALSALFVGLDTTNTAAILHIVNTRDGSESPTCKHTLLHTLISEAAFVRRFSYSQRVMPLVKVCVSVCVRVRVDKVGAVDAAEAGSAQLATKTRTPPSVPGLVDSHGKTSSVNHLLPSFLSHSFFDLTATPMVFHVLWPGGGAC
jgi:hypothetical protein